MVSKISAVKYLHDFLVTDVTHAKYAARRKSCSTIVEDTQLVRMQQMCVKSKNKELLEFLCHVFHGCSWFRLLQVPGKPGYPIGPSAPGGPAGPGGSGRPLQCSGHQVESAVFDPRDNSSQYHQMQLLIKTRENLGKFVHLDKRTQKYMAAKVHFLESVSDIFGRLQETLFLTYLYIDNNYFLFPKCYRLSLDSQCKTDHSEAG